MQQHFVGLLSQNPLWRFSENQGWACYHSSLHTLVSVYLNDSFNTDLLCAGCNNLSCVICGFPFRRPVGFWLTKAQALLYCNEHGVLGFFSEEVKACVCPMEQPTCQGVIPCIVDTSTLSCSSCASDNVTRCGACHHGNILHLGSCRPSVAPSLDHYLNLDVDIPDVEVLLSKTFTRFSDQNRTAWS